MLRLAVIDQADLGGGAAHVERQHLVEAALAGQRRGQDGAAGRARFDQADRELARGLERGEAAARGDEEEGTAHAPLAQRLVEAAEIAVHHRLDVGVGDRGRPALVLADLGRDLAGQRDRYAGQQLAQDIARAPLVLAVEIGVHVADGDRLDAGSLELGRECPHRRLVERDQHVAAAVHAFRHAKAPFARHQRRRLPHEDVVLLEAVLEGDLDGIAEALGDDQRRLGALALDDGVGRERRAVDDQAEVARVSARRASGCPRRRSARLPRARAAWSAPSRSRACRPIPAPGR